MNTFKPFIILLCQWIRSIVQYILVRVWKAFPAAVHILTTPPECTGLESLETPSEEWKTSEVLRTYHSGGESATVVMVQTDTHAFHVDLERLSECSEYFRGLSQSRMRELSEGLIRLGHVPSSIFHHLLEFSFHQRFTVPKEELADTIQVASYLLAEAFLSECLSVLAEVLTPENCLPYLGLAEDLGCAKLRTTVFTYLSRNLLEQSHLTRYDRPPPVEEGEHPVPGRPGDDRTRPPSLQTDGGASSWHPVSELPLRADQWCHSAVVLFNYLYILGGYRRPIGRGWEFKNGLFSIQSFVTHVGHHGSSDQALYSAVARYDPWGDSWRFVSSLPLSGSQFTMSHDVPLATSLGHCVYVLGNIQRTGEKLLLQYNTTEDCWSERLPTLTRADAHLPTLYFLGATDTLIVIGGNAAGNVVTSFCPRTRRWGRVVRLDLQDLTLSALPPLPLTPLYEAVFHLYF
ncbi:unnamed protein product [Boreogadus saida]